MVKVKDHLYVTFRESLVAPSHVVVPRPCSRDMAVQKVIQTPGAIRQLAQALGQSREAKLDFSFMLDFLRVLRVEIKFRPLSCCSIIHRVIEEDIQASVDHLVSIWNAIRHQAIWKDQGKKTKMRVFFFKFSQYYRDIILKICCKAKSSLYRHRLVGMVTITAHCQSAG